MIYAGADLIGSSIGLVLSPVFTRLLTPAQYGAQAALGAIWSFVALAQYGGMDSAYPNFLSRTGDAAERRRILVTASAIALLSTLVVSGALGLAGLATDWITGFAGVTRGEFFAYVLTLAPGGIMSWLLYVLRYERKAASFATVSLVGRVIGAVILIPALLLVAQGDRMWVGFLVSAAVTLLAAGLGFRELQRQGLSPLARGEFEAERGRALLRFGLVLIPGFAIYAVTTVLDRMLVTWFAGPAETAVLALALRLGALATMLRTWFALVWDPQLMEWIPNLKREMLVERLQGATGLIARAAAILAAFAALWCGPVVRLLYPEAYWATIPLVPWIVLGVGVSALSLVAVATTTLAQTSKLHLPVYAIALVVNAAVGIWWVPRIGAAGAVAGVLAGEAVILTAWILLGTRWLKNLPLSWWRPAVMLAVTAVFLAWYRSGVALPGAVWVERTLLSAIVLAVLGGPLLRLAWANRRPFSA